MDDDDTVKPGLDCFVEFARSRTRRPVPAQDGQVIDIYWRAIGMALHFYPRDNPFNPETIHAGSRAGR